MSTEIQRLDKAAALKAVEALARSSAGGEIFKGCMSAFDHPDWIVRRRASELLAKFAQNKEVVEALKTHYASGTVDQRYWIMKILAQVLGQECLPWIRKVYGQSKDPTIRTHALSAASEIEGQEASEFLVAALTDDSWLNRQAAAGYLEPRGKEVMPLLQKGFAEGSGDLKYWCLRLLVRILGPESRNTIRKGMKSEDPNIRHYVLRSLEQVEGNWEIPFLIEFLADSNWSNRQVAASLLKAKGRPALKHLAAASKSGSSDERFWAVRTLGETADERAVGPLESFLYDAVDDDESLWALEALGKIPCAAAGRAIIESSYEFADRMDRVVEVLAGLGIVVVRPVIEYIDSPNETIQKVCRKVLEALPFPAIRSFSGELWGLSDEDRTELLQAMKQIGRERLEALFSRDRLGIEQVREAAAAAPPRAVPTMSTVAVSVIGKRGGGAAPLPYAVAEEDEEDEEEPSPGAAPSSAERASSPTPGGEESPPPLSQVLEKAVRLQASDVHLKPHLPPIFRIHGNLRQTDLPVLTPDATHAFALEVLPPLQRRAFETGTFEVDAAYSAGSLGRFRVNCYQELQGACVAMRHIPGKVQTLADLKLPKVFRDLAMLNQGLVLVTGPTGSGKSTTLAAMVDFINTHREAHVITIEDPVEFVHENHMSVITYRELGSTTAAFADALRAALREDPDVILVGEMRDQETMQLAMMAAETGHLVFSTLHTSSAGESVDRIINNFPQGHHDLIRVTLAEVLRGVVTQQLVPTMDGRRIAIRDVLLKNSAVANFIREGKLHQVDQAIISGRKEGMQARDDDLVRHLKEGLISREVAFHYCTDKTVFLSSLGPGP